MKSRNFDETAGGLGKSAWNGFFVGGARERLPTAQCPAGGANMLRHGAENVISTIHCRR